MINKIKKIKDDNIKLNKVNFDCNATTPVLPGVAKAVFDSMTIHYGNPSSVHSFGLQAKQNMEFVRKRAAQLIEAEPEQIIFMSGATEAIHTAIFSALTAIKSKANNSNTKLLYGATEHKAVLQALHHWTKILGLPYEIVELPVNGSGQIILEKLLYELPQAAMLCTMAVNNETGVIQDLSVIEAALNSVASDAFWLVDSVQALGKLDMKLNSSRIDYATFSGHKVYAPKGIGFLYYRKNAPISPLIVGGGQEKGFRSGTENLSGIVGLGYVLNELAKGIDNTVFQSYKRLSFFREKLIAVLKETFPKILFNTPIEQSIPTTLNFSVPGLSSQELLDVFDAAGLCLSGGSACNASSVQSSHVLSAMGKSPLICTSAIRLSFGLATSLDEIELGCSLLRECGKAFTYACLLDNKSSTGPVAELTDGVLQFRSMATNSWMFIDKATRSCIIIDPCETAGDRIEQYVRCHNLLVLAILDTHGHADHVSIRTTLEKKLVTYFHGNTISNCCPLGWPDKASFQRMITLDNLEVIPALYINNTADGELVLAQLQTPGHTADSQTFILGTAKAGYLNKTDVTFVFSGDMILGGGGLGRTNFDTSNSNALYHSLRKLESVITRDTLICPAHDYNQSFCTSFNVELNSNSLMALALDASTIANQNIFMEQKIAVDYELTHLEENFQGVVCGVTSSIRIGTESAMVIYPQDVKNFLYNKATTPLVIDVSEKQEFFIQKDWHAMSIEDIPLNIPLTHFTNLIRELLTLNKFHQEILFICRSGERSLQAVKALRGFGINYVWSLDSGLAGLSNSQYSSAPINTRKDYCHE
jgi:cysteine desulfurase